MLQRYNLQKEKIVLNHEYTKNNHFQIGFDNCPFAITGDIFFTNYCESASSTQTFFEEIKNILYSLSNSCLIYTGTPLNHTLLKIIQENHIDIKIIDLILENSIYTCPVKTHKSIKLSEAYIEKFTSMFPMFNTFDIVYKLIPIHFGIKPLIVHEPLLEIYRFTPRVKKDFQPQNWSILEKKSDWEFWFWCLSKNIPCFPSILRYNPNIIKCTLELFPWSNFKDNMIAEFKRFAGANEQTWLKNLKFFKNRVDEEKFWTIPLFRLESWLHDKKLDNVEYFFGSDHDKTN